MLSRTALALWTLFALVLPAAPASAQDPRGSLAGTVTDATGGVLPGVTVVVTNTETGVLQNTVIDSEGRYRVLYLNPGTYAVTAELSGFKKFSAAPTRVGVGDVVRVDVALQTGGLAETVTVSADTPLLNTSTGISGTTIDSQQIAELPLGDGTAYMLTRLAPGIVDSSDLHFSRPADNGNLAGIVANGVQGGNEFTIDGAPNMSNARGVGFSPPSDAISEFKVQTSAFDAQTGHTAGAVVNLALKSGTNSFRFQGSYFNRDDSRAATPLLTSLAGGEKPTREYNRYTGTIGGPVIRNRTFFMGSFERLKDVQPEPSSYTVPTEKMRRGDFSEFVTPVYDPGFAERPAEPVLDRHGLPAAVRAQRAVGPRLGRSAGGDSRGLAVEQHLPVSERRTAHLGKRLLRLRLRRSAGAQDLHRQVGVGRRGRDRRAGVGDVVLLLPRRARPDQRRGQPGAPARGPADSAR